MGYNEKGKWAEAYGVLFEKISCSHCRSLHSGPTSILRWLRFGSVGERTASKLHEKVGQGHGVFRDQRQALMVVTLLHDIKESQSVLSYLGHTSSWDDEGSHIEASIGNAVQKCCNLPCILLNAQCEIIEFFLVVSNSIAIPING